MSKGPPLRAPIATTFFLVIVHLDEIADRLSDEAARKIDPVRGNEGIISAGARNPSRQLTRSRSLGLKQIFPYPFPDNERQCGSRRLI